MLRQVLFILFCVYDCELVKYHNKKIMNESKISVLKAGHILVNKSKDSSFFFFSKSKSNLAFLPNDLRMRIPLDQY